MPIDLISWIGCDAQTQMSPLEWLGILKLNAQRADLDDDTREAIDELARTAGPCAACFEPDGTCHRTINFPIDETAERVLFDFFLRQLREQNSPGDQIYRDFLDGAGSQKSWERRSGEDRTHEADAPFSETLGDGRTTTTTEMFAALFADVRGVEAVTAHGLFWRGFTDFVPQAIVARSKSLAELIALAPLFEATVRQTIEGAPECDVLFFVK